jgi:FixJ family two-component response regulator
MHIRSRRHNDFLSLEWQSLVHQTSSGGQFLLSPNRFGLHCIVADVHMPGMGGLNLLQALREQGIATPVVFVTALTDQHLDEEAASRGALCLLRKPFEMSSLLDHIDRSLRK